MRDKPFNESGWAGYEKVPKLCWVCGEKITLKQSFQAHTDLITHQKGIRHTRCEDNTQEVPDDQQTARQS